MSLQYRFDKLMKKIGAYSISDEIIEIAELYRSLPRVEQRLADALDAGSTLEEAAESLSIGSDQAQAMLDEIGASLRTWEIGYYGQANPPKTGPFSGRADRAEEAYAQGQTPAI